MSTDQVSVGQVWVPKSGSLPGAGLIRIVARYPFRTHVEEIVWIVEHMDYVHKLERIPEETLTTSWRRAEEPPTKEGRQ